MSTIISGTFICLLPLKSYIIDMNEVVKTTARGNVIKHTDKYRFTVILSDGRILATYASTGAAELALHFYENPSKVMMGRKMV